ncbi:DUF2147 domain-containing protein [Inhella sp.]|uniref:DUF2147 domain-containing protein n=1 Tax=Inhella sp. TaxID=1921806 RepID=UPI0035B39066
MKSLIAAAVLGLFALGAHAQMSPVGVWKTIDDETKQPKALVRITEANGVVSGRIDKLLAADAKPDAKCDKCEDDRKDKPIVGMEIIRDVKKDDDVWGGGTILDSAKGKVYKTRLKPVDGGKRMEVRGYVGFFYRTQVWERVE